MRNRSHGLKPGSLLARLEGLLTAIAVAFPNPGVPTLLSPKRRQRALKLSHWKAAAMGGAAVLTMATGVTPAGVSAIINPPFANLGAAFEMDGNIHHNAATASPCDWGNLNTPPAIPITEGPACTTQFDASGVISDLYTGKPAQDPSAFTTGSSDVNDIGNWGCTTKPFDAKNNILFAYGASFLVAPTTPDATNPMHRVVYFGQERESNNGDAFAGFWLLHGTASCTPPATGNAAWSGAHQNGDLLVVSNYVGGGSTNQVDIYAWENGALNQTPIVDGPDCGTQLVAAACTIDNNSTTLPKPAWGSQALDTNEFVETAVDLTAVDETLAGIGVTATSCFSHFLAETRSSQSATADLHDYAQGRVNTCPTPGITTHAQQTTSMTVGQTANVGDRADLTGGNSPSGSVTFDLYGPTSAAPNGVCDNSTNTTNDHVLGPFTASVSGGSATTTGHAFKPTQTGDYYWVADYTGDNLNNDSGPSQCGDPNEKIHVGPASPDIATTPSSTAVAKGTTFHDTAVVGGNTAGYNPGASPATVTFDLYGPFSSAPGAESCVDSGGSANRVYQNTQSTPTSTSGTASATYTSGNAPTTLGTGTYQWVAHYSGNDNNNAADGACGDTSEQVTVDSISTTASVDVNAGQNISDSATVSGGSFPNDGTVVFNLYGPFTSQPGANDCTQTSLLHSTASIAANSGGTYTTATYSSGNVKATDSGWYQWVAAYTGGGHDANVSGLCGDTAEQVTADSIATTPSAGVSVGQDVSDSATVTGAGPFTGTVTFRLYGPFSGAIGADSCNSDNLVHTSPAESAASTSGNTATFNSDSYTATAAGTYQWVASYSGDTNDAAVSGACGDTTEQVGVATPHLVLAKTADHTKSVAAGTPIGFTVKLTNDGAGEALGVILSDTLPNVPTTSGALWTADSPTFTGGLSGITCDLTNAAPQVLTCGGTGFTMPGDSSISVHLSHATDSASPGTYPNTASVTSTNTSAPNASATEYVEALSTTPSISSAAQTPAQVSDTATVAGGNAPTGTITFELFGPGDTSCGTNLVAGNSAYTVALDATGHATSPAYTATAAGTYQWVALYSGDTKNSALSGACGDGTEQFTTFTVAVLPAKTGDTSIFMLLGIPFILTGLVLFGLSWRRREEQA